MQRLTQEPSSQPMADALVESKSTIRPRKLSKRLVSSTKLWKKRKTPTPTTKWSTDPAKYLCEPVVCRTMFEVERFCCSPYGMLSLVFSWSVTYVSSPTTNCIFQEIQNVYIYPSTSLFNCATLMSSSDVYVFVDTSLCCCLRFGGCWDKTGCSFLLCQCIYQPQEAVDSLWSCLDVYNESGSTKSQRIWKVISTLRDFSVV